MPQRNEASRHAAARTWKARHHFHHAQFRNKDVRSWDSNASFFLDAHRHRKDDHDDAKDQKDPVHPSVDMRVIPLDNSFRGQCVSLAHGLAAAGAL